MKVMTVAKSRFIHNLKRCDKITLQIPGLSKSVVYFYALSHSGEEVFYGFYGSTNYRATSVHHIEFKERATPGKLYQPREIDKRPWTLNRMATADGLRLWNSASAVSYVPFEADKWEEVPEM